ncbi:MAG: hypothetical protein LBO72_06160 [Helicobacteraceae bacterium]|jgi:hypothetical protein|nr:hypothetical protein [Helicobacteraceae bacterium]
MNAIEERVIQLAYIFKDKLYEKPLNCEENYNKYLDGVSNILSSIAQEYINKYSLFSSRDWVDDILIRTITIKKNTVKILGILIIGKSGSTISEWVTPLLFMTKLNDDWSDFIWFKYCFYSDDIGELDYAIYNKKKLELAYYFDRKFYHPNGRWKYKIRKDKQRQEIFSSIPDFFNKDWGNP